MRLVIIALLLSAGSAATAQANPPAAQSSNPASCNSALQSTSPAPGACIESVSPAISSLPTIRPNLNWTGRDLQQVKPAIPAQLLTGGQNPVQLLALNRFVPQGRPNPSPRAKAEPIPTTYPDAHSENIPTSWPGLKFLLIDQLPSANKPTEAKTK